MEPFLAICRWHDAWGNAVEATTTRDVNDGHRPTVMEIVGWVLVDDQEGVSIFSERCLDLGDGSYRGRTFIPRAMVKAIVPVPLPKPRKIRNRKPPLEAPTPLQSEP